MIVSGAAGQASFDSGDAPAAAGGKGGRETATIPVVAGDTLHVYVGQSGDTVPLAPTHGWQLPDPVNPGAYVMAGAFGGGGLSSSNYGGFGGGGSFVFDSQLIPGDPTNAIGNLLIAAGGGGGAGYDGNQFVSHGATGAQKSVGGAGSGAAAASDGVAVGLSVNWGGTGFSPSPGGGATLLAAGAGGVPTIPPSYAFGQQPGGPGAGPASLPDEAHPAYTSLYLGAGGSAAKGTCCYYYGYGGAGGGGWFGGGAGGTIDGDLVGGGGGGGAGFVASNATATLSQSGVQSGHGRVTLRYLVPAKVLLSVVAGGSGAGTITSTPPGISCGATCGASFDAGTSVTLSAAPAPGSIFVGWLGACTGSTCVVPLDVASAVQATFAPATTLPRIDIDGDGQYDALTDGLLMLRYLFGLTGDPLVHGAISATALRTTPTEVAQFMTDVMPLMDVDGNGQCDALTDGLMLIRYLFGLRGPSLIMAAVGVGATRSTASAIETQIQSVMPAP
jgi:hypothetical protein